MISNCMLSPPRGSVIPVAEVRAAWKLCTRDAAGRPGHIGQVKNYLYTCTKGLKIVSGGPGIIGRRPLRPSVTSAESTGRW
jgi:hypothetical protein